MEEFKVLQSKKCLKCGTVINGTHHKPPFLQRKIPKGFYGNNIKKTIISICDCGERYISLLRPKGNSYEIVDLARFEGGPEPELVVAPENVEDKPKEVPEIKMSEEYMRLKFKMLSREELEETATDMGIKGGIKVWKDDTIINKLLNL